VTLKVRVFNKYGVPQNLAGLEKSIFFFNYEDGRVLEKKSVKIKRPDRGELLVELTDFEVQGLPLGLGQNFMADLTINQKKHNVLFYKALNIVSENGRKVIMQ